jgi:hypothetical protein
LDEVSLDGVEIVQLSIEMAGKQQDSILKFAAAVHQGALPEADDRQGGADRNGCDQQDSNKDQQI